MLYILECSNLEQTVSIRDDNDVNRLSSSCDQAPQTEDVLDLTNGSAKNDIIEDQGKPSTFNRLQNETDV